MSFEILDENNYPWELLLDADPSRKMVNNWLARGVCVGMYDEGLLVGEFVLAWIGDDRAELANIAVRPDRRGQGIAKGLIQECVRRARSGGARTLEVGTGNAGIGQLALYQKCGFRIVGIDLDFFVRNYEEPIEENGIPCRDMIRLRMEL
ncbi:MAG: GNAT family N-acetyltransferase [Spirochaeta sp.]|nr:GNAT family N-acetyltransferase [Spirochaeta sp.]